MSLAALAVILLAPVDAVALGSPLQPADTPPRCFGRVATIDVCSRPSTSEGATRCEA